MHKMQAEATLLMPDGSHLLLNAMAPFMIGREHHTSVSPQISRYALSHTRGETEEFHPM